MIPSHRSHLPPNHRAQGSALLLTLLVASLLMVMVLSFVVFVRMELRIVINNQQLREARANARLGAMLALGELQRTMGPDMRISARAEILSSSHPDDPDSGVSPFTADESMRFWTGTWTSEDWDPGDSADRQGRFLRWLASMPKSVAENIATVNSLDVRNDTYFITLATLLAEPAGGGSPSDSEVRAGLLPIPSVYTAENTGTYAWWVSDEGVKANLAQSDPYTGVADPGDIEDGNFDAEIPQFLYPNQPNLSLTTWFGNLDRNASYAEALNRNLEKASGLFGSAGLALDVAETDIVNNDDVKSTLRDDNLFADYSFFSHGVMASTRRGGLRGDLSLAFWEDAGRRFPVDENRVDTNAPFEEDFRFRRIYSPIDYDNMTQGGGSPVGSLNPFGPRWEALRDFHNSFQKITTDPDGYQVVRAATSDLDSNPNQSYHEQPRRDRDSSEAHAENLNDILRRLGNNARSTDVTNDGRGGLANSENLKSPVFPILTRFIMEFQGTLIENPDQEPTIANGGSRDPALFPTTYRPEIRIALFVTLWNPYNVPISLANPNGYRGGGLSAIQGRLNIHFSPGDFGIFQIEIDGQEWDVGGGKNNEITRKYESLIPQIIYGRGRNNSPPSDRKIGRFPYVMADNRTDPLINSDFEAGEVRLFAIDGVSTDLLTAEYYDGSFARSLGSLTPAFSSVDVAGWSAFRETFKEKLGFWGDPNNNLGFANGQNVSFQLKINSTDDTPQFDTAFSGYSANASNQRPVTNVKTTIDLTIQPEQQLVRAGSGDVVSLGYIEFILKSGNETDPRDFTENIDMPVPRFTHFNPRAWVANDANTPYGKGQNPNYWFGVVREGDRANYTDTVRSSGPRSALQYHRAYWGADHLPGDGRNFLTLFDVPRRPVESMGQYQHAYLSWLANQPSYAFGNSLADIHVPSNGVIARYDDGPDNDTVTYMDLSWLLNDSLWDDYFLSTIDPYVPSGTRLRPQRSRFVELDKNVVYNRGDSPSPTDEINYSESAGNLLLRGAFNVNSTSVEAWKAVLAGLGNDGIPYLDPTKPTVDETTGALDFPYYRSSLPLGPEDEAWTGGPRNLTDAQMTALAESIVEQVKLRGPFLSISDFVNRRIGSDNRAQMGAIQAAIDEQNNSIQDLVETVGDVTFPSGEGPRYWTNLPNSIRQKPLAFAPGDLTQADILTTIGPLLSARSDTFVIRSYGSILNGQSGKPQAQAWCEMLVQRKPTAVQPDSADPYATGPFGRSFHIVGFRYLDPNDL
jgi:hypothetical protein